MHTAYVFSGGVRVCFEEEALKRYKMEAYKIVKCMVLLYRIVVRIKDRVDSVGITQGGEFIRTLSPATSLIGLSPIRLFRQVRIVGPGSFWSIRSPKLENCGRSSIRRSRTNHS